MPDTPRPPTFEIYIDDDRYAVPTLHLVVAEDEDGAREAVERLLLESPHHLGAELCLNDEVLLRAGTYTLTPRPGRSRALNGFFAYRAAQATS